MAETRKIKKIQDNKELLQQFSLKMSANDVKKLDQIRKFLNMDSYSSVIRKIIRDYKLK